MKRLLTAVAIAAAAFTAAASAAPPVISVPTQPEVKAGRILTIEPKGEYDQARWRLQYGVSTDGRLVKPTSVDLVPICAGKSAHFASVTPGEYVVLLTVWNKDGISDMEVRITVTGAEPAPAPPGPGPGPGPAPGPTAKRIYVAVIRDSAAITPALAGVIGDTKFMNDAVGPGSDWDAFDSTSAEADKKGYLNQAKKIQPTGTGGWVPTLLVLDRDTGKVLSVTAFPASKDAFKAAVDALKAK